MKKKLKPNFSKQGKKFKKVLHTQSSPMKLLNFAFITEFMTVFVRFNLCAVSLTLFFCIFFNRLSTEGRIDKKMKTHPCQKYWPPDLRNLSYQYHSPLFHQHESDHNLEIANCCWSELSNLVVKDNGAYFSQ